MTSLPPDPEEGEFCVDLTARKVYVVVDGVWEQMPDSPEAQALVDAGLALVKEELDR